MFALNKVKGIDVFMNVVIGILLPFIGTCLGAFLVFFIKGNVKKEIERFLLGFAGGVMIAASIWSLLIPSISLCKGIYAWIIPSLGFMCGVLFLLFIDFLVPYFKFSNNGKLKRTTMLMLAVTIHNIPEGMAVGAIFAGFLSGNAGITYAGAIAFTIGIAVQNFPEGAIISMPFLGDGCSKFKSFLYGVYSGIVEPIAAFLMIILTSLMTPIMPFLLSFAAGAMIYVVAEELIPGAKNFKESNIGTIGVSLGFVLMMILDVAFG